MKFNNKQKRMIEKCFIDRTFISEEDYSFVYDSLTSWDKDEIYKKR